MMVEIVIIKAYWDAAKTLMAGSLVWHVIFLAHKMGSLCFENVKKACIMVD